MSRRTRLRDGLAWLSFPALAQLAFPFRRQLAPASAGRALALLLALAALAPLAAPAWAATPGFEEDFATGSGGFGGGATVTHVTSGGVGGAGDGYIAISRTVSGNLGAFTQAVELVGDLPADGVAGYSFWLRDVGADDAHEIHVGVGDSLVNFWLSVPGFVPPDGAWEQFSVDLADESQWVQIIGTGSFQAALAATDHLLFRHDLPPIARIPNSTTGDFGLDRIRVLAVSPAIPTVSAPGRLALVALLGALAAAGLRRRVGSREVRSG